MGETHSGMKSRTTMEFTESTSQKKRKIRSESPEIGGAGREI